MLYSILCYESETAMAARSPEEDAALMARLIGVQKGLIAQGKLATAARLMPTTAATTVMCGRTALVLDGPFVETKEQLLGIYILDCANLQAAIEAASLLAREKSTGGMEIRPIAVLNPAGPSITRHGPAPPCNPDGSLSLGEPEGSVSSREPEGAVTSLTASPCLE